MDTIDFSIGILAGGKSSRMGSDKADLIYKGVTFLERLISEFSGYDDLIISAARSEKSLQIPQRLIFDEHDAIGPIEGIYQILKTAKHDHAFICAVDMPFVKAQFAKYLAGSMEGEDCCVPTYMTRIFPTCAIYTSKALPVIEKMIAEKNYRLMDLLSRLNTKRIAIEDSGFPNDNVININTLDDYLALKS